MKKILFFTMFIIFVINLNAQVDSIKLAYTSIVQIDSISKDELYNNAKLWFVTTYKSSKDVIQIDDKENGTIVGKALIKYQPKVFMGSSCTSGYIKYNICINLKNNRYKYTITDFYHEPYTYSECRYPFNLITTDTICPIIIKNQFKGWNQKVWDDIKNQINAEILPLIESLNNSMKNSIEKQKTEDNW